MLTKFIVNPPLSMQVKVCYQRVPIVAWLVVLSSQSIPQYQHDRISCSPLCSIVLCWWSPLRLVIGLVVCSYVHLLWFVHRVRVWFDTWVVRFIGTWLVVERLEESLVVPMIDRHIIQSCPVCKTPYGWVGIANLPHRDEAMPSECGVRTYRCLDVVSFTSLCNV